MIIEIDGFFHNQVLLFGKKYSKYVVRRMYSEAMKQTFELKDFPHVFCQLYDFEQIPYSEDVEVDFVLDTDIDYIYSPSY